MLSAASEIGARVCEGTRGWAGGRLLFPARSGEGISFLILLHRPLLGGAGGGAVLQQHLRSSIYLSF